MLQGNGLLQDAGSRPPLGSLHRYGQKTPHEHKARRAQPMGRGCLWAT